MKYICYGWETSPTENNFRSNESTKMEAKIGTTLPRLTVLTPTLHIDPIEKEGVEGEGEDHQVHWEEQPIVNHLVVGSLRQALNINIKISLLAIAFCFTIV